MVTTTDAERVLTDARSAFNTIRVTEDAQGLRAMWFGANRVRQSVIRPGAPHHLESPYPPAMIAGLALAERIDRLAVLGLGGGTIPAFLRAHLQLCRIDVVEIDPIVADIARRFFGFAEDPMLRLYIEDARRFLERSSGRYDAIIVDCSDAGGIPPHLATREFLLRARGQVAQGGVVIGNIWSQRANRHYDSMIRTYCDVFESVILLSVPEIGNQIVHALPQRLELTAADFVARARAFAQQHRLPIDLAAAAAHGFRRGEEELVQGAVLRDPGVA
jgi:spermidine synthase